mgnify:CR=1 FL=1
MEVEIPGVSVPSRGWCLETFKFLYSQTVVERKVVSVPSRGWCLETTMPSLKHRSICNTSSFRPLAGMMFRNDKSWIFLCTVWLCNSFRPLAGMMFRNPSNAVVTHVDDEDKTVSVPSRGWCLETHQGCHISLPPCLLVSVPSRGWCLETLGTEIFNGTDVDNCFRPLAGMMFRNYKEWQLAMKGVLIMRFPSPRGDDV